MPIPNCIKNSSQNDSKSLRSGNLLFGVDDNTSYAPTEETGYWAGISPPVGGYTVYISRSDFSGSSIYIAADDAGLIYIASRMSFTEIASIEEAFVYFASSPDASVLDKDYPSISSDKLVYFIDIGTSLSYPRSGETIHSLNSSSSNNATIITENYATYSSDDGGYISINSLSGEYIQIPQVVPIFKSDTTDDNSFTVDIWVNFPEMPSDGCYIISQNDNFPSKSDFFIRYSDGVIKGGFIDPVGPNVITTGNGFSVPLDTWINIKLIYDWDLGILSLYKNSSLISQDSVGQFDFICCRDVLPYYIGINPGNTQYTSLKISALKIYNKALTVNEISQNYVSLVNDRYFNVQYVLNYDISNTSSYPGSGSTLYDISGSGFDASLSGTTYNSGPPKSLYFGLYDRGIIPANSTLYSYLDASANFTIQIWHYFTVAEYNWCGLFWSEAAGKNFLIAYGAPGIPGGGYGRIDTPSSANYIWDSGTTLYNGGFASQDLVNNWVMTTIVKEGSTFSWYQGDLLKWQLDIYWYIPNPFQTIGLMNINTGGGYGPSANLSKFSLIASALSQEEISILYDIQKEEFGL